MAKKTKRDIEKELREKIQNELHQKFKQTQDKPGPASPEPSLTMDDSSFIKEQEERLLRLSLEEEIYGKYPEFVYCENHLNEARWLTPAELEGEYEFYPVEETRFERFKKRFSKKASLPKIDSPEQKKRMEAMRKEIQEDAKKRIQQFEARKQAMMKSKTSEIEQKIYQEEIDKFYSRKKGYKKYINHLNETRWMTKEEHKNQDEFIDEVETPAQIWRRRGLIALAVLGGFALIWLVSVYNSSEIEDKAYVLVSSNEAKGQLYIDKVLAAGYTEGQVYAVTPGEHEIALLREGFSSKPKYQVITAAKNDTVAVHFTMEAKEFDASGMVRVSAPYPDAGIIVNGEFHGTLENAGLLILPEGNYTIILEKPGYAANPPQQTFRLSTCDTVEMSFTRCWLRNTGKQDSSGRNSEWDLLEVRSNIKNADIYLDGQKTMYKTDYILQRIPLGSHIVRVEKKGYKVYPEEQVVRLNRKEKQSTADFTLTSQVRRVTLNTKPVSGDIFVDGRLLGNGEVNVSLALGEHDIRFGETTLYKPPAVKKIVITEDSPQRLTFTYILNYNVFFKPDQKSNTVVKTGYLFSDNIFHQSNKAGPETELNKTINEKVWKLGYAFQYRNPPGEDALLLNIFIPANLDLSQPLALKLWIYKTKDLYPLILKAGSYYSVNINQYVLRKSILPGHSEKEIGNANYDSFLINEFLHPGNNQILIKTTTSTNSYVMLWKAQVGRP
ncbi:hypothetical protein DRI50_11320 [candidate division KSB1 bacterium]|nr:MAG: hypothetical protein DRI50_11320 [candidate division KSB1 bacterium]